MINSIEINRALSKLTDVRALLDIAAESAEAHAKHSMACTNLKRVSEVCSDMVTEAMEKLEASLEGIL